MPTAARLTHQKKAFLEAFRLTGNVSQSAAAAGVERRTAYRWQEHDDAFAASYRDAEIHATELLEAEAHRRAVFGCKRYKGIYHDGVLIDTLEEIAYSDTLLIFLLKARAPEKYRERVDIHATVVPMAVAYDVADLALIRGEHAD